LQIAKYWFIDNLYPIDIYSFCLYHDVMLKKNPIDILCSSYWLINDLEVLYYA